ncbi:cytochrome c biogenesis CcdA family protein [Actinotalea sp.]|uniref:cytochrome c biogenesis CcdA family protein n=1 Tax=Actinotalea sp. TaxID=1872145 RepID=UPI003564EE1A
MDPAVLTLAFVAGAVAAFNPCGFALLPAYLTLLVADPDGEQGRGAAASRALRFTAGMTVGFVAVFGAFALIIAPLAVSIERWLPVLTVVLGVVLVGLGGWLLSGREMKLPAMRRGGTAPGRSWWSKVGYGVTFALASLSCTIAPFLAVTTTALRTGSIPGVVAAFVIYALGMGAVVGVLAIAAATASSSITSRLRQASPIISRLSGALLLLAGAYVAWYGWFELRVLSGQQVDDPVVDAAIGVQSWLTRTVAGLGTGGVAAVAAVVLAVAVVVLVQNVRRRRAARAAEVAGA